MASTINAALSALVGLLQAETQPGGSLTGVSVYDGQPMEAEDDEWIAIGFQSGSANAVEITYDWASLGAMRQKESYNVLCSLLTTSGDEDMATRRVRAVELRDAIAAVLAANRGLGLLTLDQPAHISASTLLQEQDGQGAMAGFLFTVTVTARIAS